MQIVDDATSRELSDKARQWVREAAEEARLATGCSLDDYARIHRPIVDEPVSPVTIKEVKRTGWTLVSDLFIKICNYFSLKG